MNQKISVIVPIYNVEQFLNRCVQSIVSQTYENIQIILVDDGSPDNCPKLCDEWAHKDKRIEVIHKKNGGLSSARNEGLKIADGEYVVFVDSDDYIKNTMIEDLFNLCIENNAEIAICNFARFSGEMITEDELKNFNHENKKIQVHTHIEALEQLHAWNGDIYTVAWNKIYKRSLWDGIEYPVGKINEDEFTTYKIFYKAKNVVVTNDIYYYYYYNANSITTNEKYLENTDVFEAFDERKNLFLNDGHVELAKIVEKIILDRVIMRYRKAKINKSKNASKMLVAFYKEQYKKLSIMKPGIGYKIFYVSPILYELLLKITGR